MSPFSIKFQANWRKLKIRTFFRTSEISLTHKFHYHHHVQDTRYTLNTNFQANRKKLKIRPFFRTVEISLERKFYYHHHVQDTRYTQNTKFQANRTRLKFREFSEFRAKTKNRRIFLLVPIYSECPIYPMCKISSQSDKVEISRIQWISCENEKSQNFFISAIVLRIPNIP